MAGRGDWRTRRRGALVGITPALERANGCAHAPVSVPCRCGLPGDPGRARAGGHRPGRALAQVSTGAGAGLLPLNAGATSADATDDRERRIRIMKWITWEQVGVDRMACAWLIKTYLDSEAEFLFVPAGYKS